MALLRAVLDLSLIGGWVWLASDSLPQPVPALGAALFGAASAGYWAMNNSTSVREVEDEKPSRAEEAGRLNRFAGQMVKESASANGQWFEQPGLGNRMSAEAERCENLAIPLSVVFIRTRPASLANWAEGSVPRTLSDVLAQVLDGSRQKYMCGPNGREAVIAFAGGDRSAAEELTKKVFREIDSRDCEAGIVMHPEEGIEPTALAAVARLRLRPVQDSSGESTTSAEPGSITPDGAPSFTPGGADNSETAAG
jgi:hypothetical protein